MQASFKPLLFGLLLLSSLSTMAAAKNKVLKPYLHNKKVQVEVSGKEKAQNYFQLSSRHGTFYRPDGPGQLTLFIRSEVTNSKQAAAFKVKVILDGVKVSVHEVPARKISKKSKLRNSNAALSVAAKIGVRIPPGRHKLEVLGMDLQGRTIVRAYFKDHPEPKWKPMPLASKAQTLQLRSVKTDKLLDYQRINDGQSLQFQGMEKQYVRIFFRGEFKSHMFADNTVRLDLYQDGKLLRSIRISSKRSTSMVYADGGSLVPGTLNKFFFEIPAGNHQYEIKVADKRKSVLVRVAVAPIQPEKTKHHEII